MDLLLITSSWPHAEVTKFLDDEIHYLAEQFDRVVVAPMRPRGPLTAQIPEGVVIDHSLADYLVRSRLLRSRSSRILTAAVRAAQPNPAGFGCLRDDVRRDGLRRSWIRQTALSRADSTSVAQWAASRHAPALAYTFWLGAATVGLHQAWPSVPLVSRVHGSELYSEPNGWSSIPYQAAAIQGAVVVAAVSEQGRAYLVDKFPREGHKLVVRRLGVPDLGGLAPRLESGPIRILSASSVTPVKRVDRILEVVKTLAMQGHRVEWTHLGGGPGEAELRRAVGSAPAGLTASLTGHVPLAAVHHEMLTGNYGVFVNLSLSEGAPVSLMEAQCVGLPVVATEVGGSSEVSPRTLNELVDPSDSLADICAAILRAANRPPGEAKDRRTRWAELYGAASNYSSWAEELTGLTGSRVDQSRGGH